MAIIKKAIREKWQSNNTEEEIMEETKVTVKELLKEIEQNVKDDFEREIRKQLITFYDKNLTICGMAKTT
jgi:hypothetical protein